MSKFKLRIINFRAFLIIAFLTIAAIFFALIGTVYLWLGWLLLLLTVGILLAIVLYLLKRDAKKFKYITLILAIFFVLAAFINFTVQFNLWNNKSITENTEYKIFGTVEKISAESEGQIIVINNVKIDEEKINGRVQLNVISDISVNENIYQFIKVGDIVTVTTALKFKELTKGLNVLAYNKRTDIRYYAYVNGSGIAFEFGNPSFLIRFSENIKSIIENAMGKDYGSIAYGMLTGNKDEITREVRSDFTVSGLGHILAVSGLHIGFICTLFAFVLKKLKTNRKISFFIITSFLVFYLFICSFSPSVIRAVIMCEAMLFANLLGKRNDMLNSLSFAVCIILVISPFYLFDVGFILSAGAVFSLILFSKPIKNLFRKIKLPNFLASALSASICAQIGTIPAMIFFFSEFQLYSIAANLFLIPIIMGVFIAVFVSLLFALIAPVFSILLKISGAGLAFITAAAGTISLFPYASIAIFSTEIIFLCYPLYFLASRFIRTKRKFSIFRFICSIMSVILCLNGLVFYPKAELNNVIIPIDSYNDVTSIVVYGQNTYIVGDFKNSALIINTKKKYRLSFDETIFVTELTEAVAEELVFYCRKYRVSQIYCPATANIDGLQILMKGGMDNFYLFGQTPENESIFRAVYADEDFLAYKMTADNINILFYGYKQNYTKTDIETLNSSAIIRTYLYRNSTADRIYITNIKEGFLGEFPTYQYSVYEYENLIFNFKTGEIIDDIKMKK